ncbi:carbon-nitrogen hydrolase family protein [Actinophytocola sp.]|uniref:carbon-nitrogen hydrolase family protein n=1 Tax=Actinophytocola sp. TaxID=1872138 RepID=UPI003D6AD03E
MTETTIAVLQLAAVPGDVAGNVDRYLAALRAHGGEADLVVTPELCLSGYDLALVAERGAELAEPLDGPAVTETRRLAAELDTTVVVGLLERDGDTLHDSAVVVTPGGAVHSFRKTHLYPAEVGHFAAGDRLVTVDTPAGRLGPLICFEHAFPELATTLALAGTQLLVIPSAVPVGFEHLLRLRTRARAQDNQLFAVAANLAGGGFCGGSLIAGPKGEVLAEAGPAEQVLWHTVDLGEIVRERVTEPALALRQPELYRAGSVEHTGAAHLAAPS